MDLIPFKRGQIVMTIFCLHVTEWPLFKSQRLYCEIYSHFKQRDMYIMYEFFIFQSCCVSALWMYVGRHEPDGQGWVPRMTQTTNPLRQRGQSRAGASDHRGCPTCLPGMSMSNTHYLSVCGLLVTLLHICSNEALTTSLKTQLLLGPVC